MPPRYYQYKAFGLTIDSELELPMLKADFAQADVVIQHGNTPESISNVLQNGLRYQVAENEFLLHVDNIARYWVQNGNQITIQQLAEITHEESHLYLLGSVFGALLQQRNILTLHASAVEFDGRAVLFLGNSGSGKSTIAAAFRKSGHKTLTDDLCAISFAKTKELLAVPSYPNSKLWIDSLQEIGLKPSHFSPVRPRIEKRSVSFEHLFQKEPLPIKSIFLLAPNSTYPKLELARMTAVESLSILIGHTYRKSFLDNTNKLSQHFQSVSEISNRISVFQLKRPDRGFNLNEMLNSIIEQIRI